MFLDFRTNDGCLKGYGYNNQIWTTIETGVGIICACVPILHKQFSAEGVYGRKINAGWKKLRSRKTTTATATTSSSGTGSMPVSSQADSWQSTTALTENGGNKYATQKSLTDSQIGISQTYTVSRSEKTFYDSESV